MLRSVLSVAALRHLRPGSNGGVRVLSTKGVKPKGDLSHTEEEARALFESWCKEYNKTYCSEKEKEFRFGMFKKTLAVVTRRNQDFEIPCLGTNGFADQTKEERDRRMYRPYRKQR